VNRPTPACLAGPNWRLTQWLKAARDIGLAVRSAADSDFTVKTRTAVSVVGDRSFGVTHPELKQAACRLTRATGVQLLRVWFGGEETGAPVLGADLWPDLGDPEIGTSVMELVSAGALA
jgi:hypothetical protein